jgi:hypothetical protein
VIFTRWIDVNKAMKEFKKKRHAAFYLEVKDLGDERFRVRVYKHATALGDL